MTAQNFIQNASSKLIVGFATLLIAVFAFAATNQPASAQERGKSPHAEMKNPKPDGKDCYKYEGKRLCLEAKEESTAKKEESGSPSKLKAAPKPSRAPKDCYWYNGRLYCITYGIQAR